MGKWIFSIFFICLYSRETLGERKGFVIFFFNWSILALQCCICIGVQQSYSITHLHGLPRWLRVKNLPAMHKTKVDVGSTLGQVDILEEGMATHSNILVWRISWTLEPGGLQSIVSQAVGHNWSDWAHTNMHIYIHTFPHSFISYGKILKEFPVL